MRGEYHVGSAGLCIAYYCCFSQAFGCTSYDNDFSLEVGLLGGQCRRRCHGVGERDVLKDFKSLHAKTVPRIYLPPIVCTLAKSCSMLTAFFWPRSGRNSYAKAKSPEFALCFYMDFSAEIHRAMIQSTKGTRKRT